MKGLWKSWKNHKNCDLCDLFTISTYINNFMANCSCCDWHILFFSEFAVFLTIFNLEIREHIIKTYPLLLHFSIFHKTLLINEAKNMRKEIRTQNREGMIKGKGKASVTTIDQTNRAWMKVYHCFKGTSKADKSN